jgi:4-hydroxymandelate oxidase
MAGTADDMGARRFADDLTERARSVLSAEAFAYFSSGSAEQITLDEQEQAWREIRLRPRVLRDVSSVDTSATLLGDTFASPVCVAPTAYHALAHPEGETATARGARESGQLFVLSMRASSRLADVAHFAGPFWQQIYVLRDRGISDDIARRAADEGARALMLTVDTPHVARKPYALPVRLPATGIVPALDERDPADERFLQAADVTAADIARLNAISGLPVIAKGVLRGDDAKRCVDAGAAGVVVSTHGGRQLDRAVATARALPEVADAVADHAVVLADGGIRTGTDVLCALALGAHAVLLGRPVVWALATDGAEGVRALLSGVTSELRDALALAGCASIAEAGRDLIAPAL